MAETQAKLSVAAAKELLKGNPDRLREVVRAVLQEVLEAEMTETLGAAKGERSAGRLGYRSGCYGRTLITRVGKLELRVPQAGASRPSCSSATSAPSRRSWRAWPRCTSRASRRGR
jgi:putative transposase